MRQISSILANHCATVGGFVDFQPAGTHACAALIIQHVESLSFFSNAFWGIFFIFMASKVLCTKVAFEDTNWSSNVYGVCQLLVITYHYIWLFIMQFTYDLLRWHVILLKVHYNEKCFYRVLCVCKIIKVTASISAMNVVFPRVLF